MKILALRLARFGDIVLLLPALTLIKARLPESHLTLLTDRRWGPLAAMCPAIDEVLTIDRIGMRDGSTRHAAAEMFRLVADLRRRKFDVFLDCHAFRETNLLAWCCGAPYKLGLKRFDQSFLGFCFNQPPVLEDKSLHASESFLRIAERFAPASVSSDMRPRPSLVIPPDAERWATENLPSSPFVAFFVDAPVRERIWPLDRFAALADHITSNFGCSVVVVGDSGQAPGTFNERVCVLSGLSISRLAAVVERATMLVSNDTGPMHLGPALRVPTVAIFSVGIPEHFRPTGAGDRYVQGNPIEKVSLGQVINAAGQVWQSSGRRDPRC